MIILSISLTIHRNLPCNTSCVSISILLSSRSKKLGQLVEIYISKVYNSRGKGNRLDFAIFFFAKEEGIRRRNRRAVRLVADACNGQPTFRVAPCIPFHRENKAQHLLCTLSCRCKNSVENFFQNLTFPNRCIHCCRYRV